jgi:hypothetical protein
MDRWSTSSVEKYFIIFTYFSRGVAQPGSAPALGAGGLEFKSPRPDQNISRIFFELLKALFTQ